MSENAAKVLFRLTRDADGWPPVSSESLWATRVSKGVYELDNVPWFVRGVA